MKKSLLAALAAALALGTISAHAASGPVLDTVATNSVAPSQPDNIQAANVQAKPAVASLRGPRNLTRAEVLENVARRFDEADTDKDGVLTVQEQRAAAMKAREAALAGRSKVRAVAKDGTPATKERGERMPRRERTDQPSRAERAEQAAARPSSLQAE